LPLISQNVTVSNNDTTICFPIKVAKNIIIDLETGDFNKEENILLKEDTSLLNKKIYFLKENIKTLEKKEFLYLDEINQYKMIESVRTKKIQRLENDLESTKKERKILTIINIGLLAALIASII